MHCEDAPCLMACPTGAIAREAGTRVVKVNAELCIGCHSCSIACPFGVPRFGKDGTMQKCDLCSVRLENGLEPACVRVCPTKALAPGRPERHLAGRGEEGGGATGGGVVAAAGGDPLGGAARGRRARDR